MTFEIAFVLLSLLGMVIALILDKMRPGMILFSVVVLFLCAGILTPKEMLEGFSNKGMITVALLFWSVKVSAVGSVGAGCQEVASSETDDGLPGTITLIACGRFYFRFSEQYSGSCHFCPDY